MALILLLLGILIGMLAIGLSATVHPLWILLIVLVVILFATRSRYY